LLVGVLFATSNRQIMEERRLKAIIINRVKTINRRRVFND